MSELASVGAVKTLDLVLLELAMHRDRGEFFQKKKGTGVFSRWNCKNIFGWYGMAVTQ